MEVKQKTALLSVTVAASLAALKLAAGLLTGSVAMLASLADSAMDLFASSLNYLAIRTAAQPADHDHAYGHGKAESLAGLFQSVMVGLSGGYLIYIAVRRLSQPVPLEHQGVGLLVMVISMAATFWLVRRMRQVTAENASVALEADSLHYATDLLMNLAVIVSLGLSRFFGIEKADPILSLAIAAYVLRSAYTILRSSIDDLMDHQLDEAQIQQITDVVATFAPRVVGYHDLRTRHAGSQVFIDLHLDIPRNQSFVKAHAITDEVQQALETAFPGAIVAVHADPFPGSEEHRLPETHAAVFTEKS